ncbi:MAG TPA: hypothetical protein VF240_06470 [Pyrinomonadaceae bacterium]
MSNHKSLYASARGGKAALVALTFAALFVANVHVAGAASWKGIEPLKSRRADVERVLGMAARETMADGALHFNVAGGRVTIFFLSAKTVAVKKLSPALEGTVLQIVLQHDTASDTPESLGLDKGKRFEREAKGDVLFYNNQRDGVAYIFIGGKLRTTRYSAPAEEFAKTLKRK